MCGCAWWDNCFSRDVDQKFRVQSGSDMERLLRVLGAKNWVGKRLKPVGMARIASLCLAIIPKMSPS